MDPLPSNKSFQKYSWSGNDKEGGCFQAEQVGAESPVSGRKSSGRRLSSQFAFSMLESGPRCRQGLFFVGLKP